jgi:hypothetical protein
VLISRDRELRNRYRGNNTDVDDNDEKLDLRETLFILYHFEAPERVYRALAINAS